MKSPMRIYRLSVESALTPLGAISAGGGSGRVAIEGFLLRLVALAVRGRLIGLQPGLDQLVLAVQSGEFGNEILQYLHMRQRGDPARPMFEAIHWGQTG